jgi:transposase
MFFPEGQIRVHLYGEPVDMRKSFDGLYALTRHQLGKDALSGELFVFISRRAIQLKVLYFDRTGFCLWSKRLESGRFISDWGAVRTREMDWTSLKLLLEGIVPAQRRKRFRRGDAARIASSRAAQALQSQHAARHCQEGSAECR